MNKLFKEFIRLIDCSINNEEYLCTSKEAECLYELCEYHKITELTYPILSNLAEKPLADKIKKNHNLNQYKALMQQQAYEEIKEIMYQNNIKFMPLKGIRIKGLYPRKYFREMADIDILVCKYDMARLKDLLENAGYSYSHKGHHDVYNKQEFITIEVHETVLDKQRETGLDEYFNEPWDNTIDNIEYSMTLEKEYIYLISHLYGHFHLGGVGVRFVLDIWLFKKAYKDKINFDNVVKVLEKYGLRKFYDNLDKLIKYWFDGEVPTELTEQFAEYIIRSGVYGLTENLVKDLKNGSAKDVSYIVKRKFLLSSKEVEKRVKYKFLIPFWYVCRIFSAMGNVKETKNWLQGLRTNNEEVSKHREKMKQFGVNI